MLDPLHPLKGRGATKQLGNRFDRISYERDPEAPEDEGAPGPGTQFLPDQSKSILSTNTSPDLPFDYSVNPYRGCEHGCIYCYARPTHEYLGFSPGLDFETKILVKHKAPRLLRDTLASPGYEPKSITISGVTDPYQPIERKLRLTRGCLEVCAEFRNPVGVVTKNRLVTRDLDVLQELARFRAAAVFLSVTTLHVSLNRILEPRTSLPAQRLEAIAELAEAGVPAGVMVAPVIPGLNDSEIPSILEAAADAGAKSAGFILLRLPHGVAPLFEAWLDQHMPEKKDRILNRIRSVRGGQLNDPRFGSRMSGEGFHADQIEQLFRVACRKRGLNEDRFELSTAHFRRRTADGQMDFFSD